MTPLTAAERIKKHRRLKARRMVTPQQIDTAILDTLQRGPSTWAELCRATGVSYISTRERAYWLAGAGKLILPSGKHGQIKLVEE